MKIIPRSQWGARAPKNPPQHVSAGMRQHFVVHHSGGPSTQTVRAIQDWCMNEPPHGRGFNDVDYSFLVDQVGRVYEGRGWDVVGAHTTGYNTSGIGVCVIGNNELSDAAKASVVQLYRAACARSGRTLKVRGHRQLATTGTSCPGERISTWLQAGMPLPEDPTEEKPVTQPATDITQTMVTLTEACAKRLGKKAGEKYRLDLLLQQIAISAVDAAQAATDGGERTKVLAAIVEQRLLAIEAKLDALIARLPA